METIRACLFWLDAAPWRHWSLAWFCFGLTSLLALAPRFEHVPGGASRKRWFVLATFLTLFAFRWPTWFYRLDLNPDEAQIVAGALTLDRFLLPWKHLDPTTHGPLCEYFLILISWLGAPFNYVSARILAALLQAGALLSVWAALRQFAAESSARLAIIPGLAFWCLTSWDDFLHYSSELPGIFLMAWGTYFLALMLSRPNPKWLSTAAALAAGACLGAVPYAKLQSVPHAGLIGLIGITLVWNLAENRPSRARLLAGLVAGALLPSLVHSVYLTAFGQWHQFWFTYVVSAIDFLATGTHSFPDMPGRFLHFSATSPSFAWFFWGSLGFALLYLRNPGQPAPLRLATKLAWLVLAMAWFTVIRSGREATHYLHLLVVPLTTLVGLVLAGALARGTPTKTAPVPWRALAAFALLALIPQALDWGTSYNRFIGHTREHWHAARSDAAGYILARVGPADTMAMWGWAPHLLVETQMPHGTREAQSGNQIMQWPLTSFFVSRYMNDMQRWQPAWFVDAVGPGAFIFADRAVHAHESVPALQRLIADHYDFQADISGMRIYRRKPTALP